jgi:hypothetical protein
MLIIKGCAGQTGHRLYNLYRPIRNGGPRSLGRGHTSNRGGGLSQLWVHVDKGPTHKNWCILPDNMRIE